jgi:hypothetical protein
VTQDKPVLVFHDADPQAQFKRHTRLSLADPFGVRLEYRKYFLRMGDGFAQNDPPPGLVDLPLRMRDESLNLIFSGQVSAVAGDGRGQRFLRLIQTDVTQP